MSERQSGGRFAQGASGNRRGRPRKHPVRIETLEDLDDMVISVMNRTTKMTTGDGEEIVTLIHANMLRLASGTVKNRLAAEATIGLMRKAISSRAERMERARRLAQRQAENDYFSE